MNTLFQGTRCFIYLLLYVVLLIPTNAFAIPSGLIHLWQADGNTLDSVGGVTGTLSGNTTYATGVSGQAFSFDGLNDLFTAAVDIGPNAMTEVTFGAWIWLDTYDNNRGWVIGHDNHGYDRSLILHDNRYNYEPAAGIGYTYNPGFDFTLSLGGWHFIAASYQGNGSPTTVYVDGNYDVTGLANNGTGMSSFTVGGLSNFPDHEIDGLVDNIFIFDRALSVEELNDVYVNGLNPIPEPATMLLLGSGLVGYAGFRRKKKKS